MHKRRDLMIIGLIYGLAVTLGVITFMGLSHSSLIMRVIIADIVVTLFVYSMSTLFKNASIYDPYWSLAPMVMIIPFIQSLTILAILLIAAIYGWGIRLTINWVVTFNDLNHQDWRYDYYKQKSGRWWPLVNLFGIHLMPTGVVIGVMLPAWLALQATKSANIITVIGAIIAFAAILVQWLADTQMHTHRNTTPSKVNKQGLWRYSRHPNYLGEIVFWFAIYGMMISVNNQYMALIGPLVCMMMFMTISIPLMEKRQIKRRPEYKKYQEETRALIFLPVSSQRAQLKT